MSKSHVYTLCLQYQATYTVCIANRTSSTATLAIFSRIWTYYLRINFILDYFSAGTILRFYIKTAETQNYYTSGNNSLYNIKSTQFIETFRFSDILVICELKCVDPFYCQLISIFEPRLQLLSGWAGIISPGQLLLFCSYKNMCYMAF